MTDDSNTDPRNVADTERIVSVVAGAGLLAFAATRRSATAVAVAAAGAGLIARGVTGRSALYRAAHIDTCGVAAARKRMPNATATAA